MEPTIEEVLGPIFRSIHPQVVLIYKGKWLRACPLLLCCTPTKPQPTLKMFRSGYLSGGIPGGGVALDGFRVGCAVCQVLGWLLHSGCLQGRVLPPNGLPNE